MVLAAVVVGAWVLVMGVYVAGALRMARAYELDAARGRYERWLADHPFAAHMLKMQRQFQELAVTIGTTLTPVLQAAAVAIGRLADQFRLMPPDRD